MSELNKEMLEAEFLMQLNFAEFTDSKLTSPMRKEFLEYALSLIKELTEANDRLKGTISRLGKNNDELARVLPLAKKEIQADTVREMQERIRLEFSDCYLNDEICYGRFKTAVDRIAKEMLEGKE
jgi:hypothetical protein